MKSRVSLHVSAPSNCHVLDSCRRIGLSDVDVVIGMCPPANSKGVTGTEPVRIRLLGGFSVSVGSWIIEEGEWRLKKAAGLDKLLALAPGHRLHREQAMDLLWPDASRKAASNNLRQTLHAARRTLSSDPATGSRYLSSEGESLVLCPGGPLWVDVDAFEEAATAARRSREPAAYRAALDLYAGELSPEDRYEAWAEGRRLGLQQLYLALLVELAGLHEGRGEHGPPAHVRHAAALRGRASEAGPRTLGARHDLDNPRHLLPRPAHARGPHGQGDGERALGARALVILGYCCRGGRGQRYGSRIYSRFAGTSLVGAVGFEPTLWGF